MSNNKGYYGWIHSMNKAAIEAQQKGQDMRKQSKTSLTEEKMTPEQEQTLAQIRAEKMARGEKRNLSRLQGQDPDVAGDMEPTGNANAVAADASDGIMGDEDEFLDTDPYVTKQNLPTYSVAAKAREETRQLAVSGGRAEQEKYRAKRRAERVAARQAATEEPERTTEVVDEYGRSVLLPMESVTQKINKMLNG